MNDDEVFNLAIKSYNNYVCKTAEEFSSDYNTVLKIKKLISRYLSGDEVNFRLLLNHFTMFYNVFIPKFATIILFLKMPKEHHSVIKTIATFLNYIPDDLNKYGIDIDSVEFDPKIISFLREI